MTQNKEVKPPPYPERISALSTARDGVVTALRGNPADIDGRDFISNFGLLVKSKKQLNQDARKAVDALTRSLRTNDQYLIRTKLTPALTEAVRGASGQTEAIDLYKAAASALGLSKEFKRVLAERANAPFSPGRRRFLKRGILLALGAVGSATAGARVLQNLASGPAETPQLPTPIPDRNISPTAIPAPPPPAGGPRPEASPSPTSSPAIKETPASKPVPEKPKTPEAETPPRSELIGFTVGTPEAIEALPPSIGVVRIAADTNLMYPDGRFHDAPDHRFEEMLAAADRKGLKVILCYKADWFPGIAGGSLQPGDMEKSSPIIKDHLRSFLKHKSVKYIEVGNEIDQNAPGRVDQFWKGSMEDYAKLFKLVSENIATLRRETGNQAELVLSSFADPMGTQNNKASEEYFDELVTALKDNGIEPGQFLIAAHAYHLTTLRWIIENLQARTGAKGIIITELNVKDTTPEHKTELKKMLALIEDSKTITTVQSFVTNNLQGFDFYTVSQRDPRFPIVMDAVARDIRRAKNPKPKAPEQIRIPPKEERIFYPPELSYTEVRPLIDKLRNTHDAVLTESLFTQELSSLSPEQREKVLDAIAQAHAQALYEYYGDTDAIIGLDPGHGGSDVGSAATGRDGKSLAEKDLTLSITNATAGKLYELSKGKYRIVVLRPENPHDEDLDGDGRISTVERLQKRKAQLVKAEEYFRPNPAERGRNIVYCSIHLNGSPDPSQRGTEVYWPNRTAMESDKYRDSSRSLALILQKRIFEAITGAGLTTLDRGAKEDPDVRPPGPNSDTLVGPYVALGSRKLDRFLQG